MTRTPSGFYSPTPLLVPQRKILRIFANSCPPLLQAPAEVSVAVVSVAVAMSAAEMARETPKTSDAVTKI